MSHPSCTGLSPVKMEILLSPKYRQGDECVLKNQGRLRTRKLFISHPGKQKEIETCSHYWGKEKKIQSFFPECKDLMKLLHGVTVYQFSKLIPVLMPTHHFGSSPQLATLSGYVTKPWQLHHNLNRLILGAAETAD